MGEVFQFANGLLIDGVVRKLIHHRPSRLLDVLFSVSLSHSRWSYGIYGLQIRSPLTPNLDQETCRHV